MGVIILCQLRDWLHEELENQIASNIETKLALGLKDIESIPFTMCTFYEEREKINLIEQAYLKFDKKANKITRY